MSLRARLREAAAEPLVWMVLLGVAFFAVDHLRRARDASTIVVDAAVVRSLTIDHERRAGKPPTDAELALAIDRYVDDEVRVREAERLGLVRGDVIVRRRLVQKMDQILALSDELDPHARAASSPVERVTVEHVFVASDHADARVVADRARDAIVRGDPPAGLGDPFPHGARLADRTREELTNLLGDAASAVWALPEGAWSPVLRGPAGFHVARVVARSRRVEPASTGARPPDAPRPASLSRLRERYAVVRR